MPRRKDSFSRALADAQKRLEKAQGELKRCQLRVMELNVEIPRLQVTVAALVDQVDPVTKTTDSHRLHFTNNLLPPSNMTPEETAKWYTERSLSGVSSIPPGGAKPPAKQLSDDELLPDDLPGKPVLEK